MAHIRGATLKMPESVLVFTGFMCRAEGKLKLKEGNVGSCCIQVVNDDVLLKFQSKQ